MLNKEKKKDKLLKTGKKPNQKSASSLVKANDSVGDILQPEKDNHTDLNEFESLRPLNESNIENRFLFIELILNSSFSTWMVRNLSIFYNIAGN